ncbi:MAG: tRNA (N6-isopentenyl adenosine(37)-C2)-methylthiotransferase MiaB [bacterium]
MKTTGIKRGFYIETHGCQMNIYDSEFISDLLARNGYSRVADPRQASVIVINTCAVRDRAEKKALARTREMVALKTERPGLVVAVIGCVAQRLAAAGRSAGADVVAGFDAYQSFAEILEQAANRPHPLVAASPEPTCLYSLTPRSREGITAFVTIMQGCDNFCSYCVVPHVRGRERSKPITTILEEARRLVAVGAKEVTLIGQNVNSYRDGGAAFADLLCAVDGLGGLERVRFTTSHPKDLSVGLVEAMRDLPKVCEHLHLPLQSGSDRVLQLMNRGYALHDFKRMVEFARHEIPGLAVTTDIMVGFPTETEPDFAQTLGALGQIGFDAAFTFIYSPRDGTEAARLADDVTRGEKTARLKRAVALQNQITDLKKRALLGREVEVLVEGSSRRESGMALGRTRENWLAKLPHEGVRRGETVVARVSSVTRWIVACDRPLRKAGP